MARLIWNRDGGIADNGARSVTLTAPPDLPFAFDGIFYNSDNGTAVHLRAGGGQAFMHLDEIAAVRAYLAAL